MNKNILKYENLEPTIGNDVYIAPGAFVIGAVSLGDNSNIWFNTVLRGDIEKIKVGKFTNIQDNSTVHVMGDCPAIIGDYVTVGHGAIVEHDFDRATLGLHRHGGVHIQFPAEIRPSSSSWRQPCNSVEWLHQKSGLSCNPP